ncbi:hypothetical protein K2173_021875 [Erythroxylum novogranatense]|uniref:RING-type domain-containing protein n=1 Tax=Erythroxylum novogranatense TaxID=1862640 RepID=A0AAV8T248_9ROSI|nr:hypothetical protein K2173_021875 [Erythroxylum novogranatense]
MWGFASNAIAAIGLKKNSGEPSISHLSDCSDDDDYSSGGREEGLECPICWESFNIVENVPYVLWCGHTLCGNCVLALQGAVFEFSGKRVALPLFISCPWCHLFSFRLVYSGGLKFPRKNFFILWMVERLNDDRVQFRSSSYAGSRPIWPIGGDEDSGRVVRRNSYDQGRRLVGFVGDGDDNINAERHQYHSLYKSLDFFIHFTSKFPFVIIFLFIVFFAIPLSALILVLYLMLTVIFAAPSFLMLYFAYPTLARLLREIIS